MQREGDERGRGIEAGAAAAEGEDRGRTRGGMGMRAGVCMGGGVELVWEKGSR